MKVTARLEHSNDIDDISFIDGSEFHGRATLVSVGGDDRSECLDPQILYGSFVERGQDQEGSTVWDLTLPQFAITENGAYQLRFTLMMIPREDGEETPLSQVSLMSIDSRIIHTHTFAHLPRVSMSRNNH